MERKWHERYPQKFRCRAVERMNACDNIVRLARELHISRTLLYKWRHHLEATNGHVQSEVTIRNSRESTLRREIDKLKRLLANKIVEVDFFQNCLAKSRGSTPEQRNLWRAGVYDAIRDTVARQLECRANVPARAGEPSGILPLSSSASADQGGHERAICDSGDCLATSAALRLSPHHRGASAAWDERESQTGRANDAERQPLDDATPGIAVGDRPGR